MLIGPLDSKFDFLYWRGSDPKDRGYLTTAFRRGQWHPDGRRFLSGFSLNGWPRGYDISTKQPLGVLVPFIMDDQWLVVGPDGHYRGSKEIEEHIVYVAQIDAGHNITLSPAEFQKRYGWKNDPAKARLLKLTP